MAQADSESITAPEGFAAFASFLGTPLPENPIRALRILRKEAAAEIERLIAFLDALGGDPDLEDGADAEPTLGWPIGNGRLFGSVEDGELEPSLGWTSIINQASRNRLGHGEDYEKDDADKEDSDPGEESDAGEDDGTAEMEADNEPNGDEQDFTLPPSLRYITRLRKRRGQPSGHRTEHGFHNVGAPFPVSDLSLILIGPNGERTEIDALGYPVKATTTSLLSANGTTTSDLPDSASSRSLPAKRSTTNDLVPR